MTDNNLSYSVKVFLTSALASPGIIIVADWLLLDTNYNDFWQSFKSDTLISLALAVPVWLCFYLVTRYFNSGVQFYKRKKILLSISAVFLTFAPSLFELLSNDSYYNNFDVFDLMQPLVHAAVIVIAIFAFRLTPNAVKDKIYSDYTTN